MEGVIILARMNIVNLELGERYKCWTILPKIIMLIMFYKQCDYLGSVLKYSQTKHHLRVAMFVLKIELEVGGLNRGWTSYQYIFTKFRFVTWTSTIPWVLLIKTWRLCIYFVQKEMRGNKAWSSTLTMRYSTLTARYSTIHIE